MTAIAPLQQSHILVVTPLRRDARRIRSAWRGQVEHVGVGSAAAAQLALLLDDSSVRTLIYAGLAGGLAPGLEVGAVCEPEVVTDGDQQAWLVNAGVPRQVGRGGWRPGALVLLTLDRTAASPHDKQRLHEQTGAALIDMECLHLARQAAARGVRFHAIVAVCDDASMALPRDAGRWLDAQGNTRCGRVLLDLLRHPGELPAVVQIGRSSARAWRALMPRVARLAASADEGAALEPAR